MTLKTVSKNSIILTMRHKYVYAPPAVRKVVGFTPEGQLLTGSVVDNTGIRSTGQQVQDLDWSDSNNQFNHEWVDN